MDKGKKLEEPQTSSNSYYLRSSISSAPGISPLRIESRRDSCGSNSDSESTISVNHSIDSLGTEQAMSDQPPTWLADLLQAQATQFRQAQMAMQEQNGRLLEVLSIKTKEEERERKDTQEKLQQERLEAERREREWKELEQMRRNDEEKRERERIERQEERDREKAIERRIEKFPNMKEGENVELYLQSFENELEQAGVAKEKWKSLVTVRLTPKVKQFVGDLQKDSKAGYTEIKTRILIKAGITPAEAGQQLFNSTIDGMRGKSSGEYLQHLERLLNRIFDGAEDERDRMAMLMLAKIRSIVGDDFKLHLSNRKIRTMEDLSSALEAWEIARGKLHHEDGYKHRRYVPLTCHKCHKVGHRAFQCRSGATDPVQQQPQVGLHNREPFLPKCYTCGILGHKSPDCPNKNTPSQQQKNGEKSVPTQKRDKHVKSQAEVSLIDDKTVNMLEATLFGQQLPCLLDSGAMMTVVPMELVPPSAYTGNKVQLRGFDGSVREVDTAQVTLNILGKDWSGVVALVEGTKLDGKGLFAVNYVNDADWEIVSEFRRNELPKQVRVVETRSMVRERKVSEKDEELVLSEEKAGTSACLLSNVEHDDDSDSDEELEISDSMSGCSEEDAECEEVVV